MKLISRLKELEWLRKAILGLVMLSLFGYVLCMPIFGQNSSILRYSIYAMMVILGGCTCLYVLLYGNFKVQRSLLVVPLFAIFALVGTAIYSHDFRSWASLVLLSGSCFVLFYAFQSIKSRFIVLNIILSSLFLFSLIFIFFYRKDILNFRSFGDKDFRLGQDFDNPNNISIFSLIGYSLSLYLFLFLNKKIKVIYIFPILTMLLMGFTTGSRMFFIGFVLFTVVLFFFRFKKHKILFFCILILLVLLLIFFINLPFLATLKARFIRSFNTLFGIGIRVDTSTIERTIWADYGIYLGSKSMFFGLGAKGFSVFSGTETYAHNNYAELFCDFGLFGFILFYFPLVFCAYKNFSKKGSNGLAMSFIIYYIVAGFFNVFYYNKIYYLVLALLFYLSFGNDKLLFKSLLVPKIKNIMFIVNDFDFKKALLLKKYYSSQGINCCCISFDRKFKQFICNVHDDEVIKYNSFGMRKLIKNTKPDVIINFSEALYFKMLFIVSFIKKPYFNVILSNVSRISIINRISFRSSTGTIIESGFNENHYSKLLTKNAAFLPIFSWLSSGSMNGERLLQYLSSFEADGGF